MSCSPLEVSPPGESCSCLCAPEGDSQGPGRGGRGGEGGSEKREEGRGGRGRVGEERE